MSKQNINPNVAVGEESNSESKIGEMTSFDQLDRITDDQIKSDVKNVTSEPVVKDPEVLEPAKGQEVGAAPKDQEVDAAPKDDPKTHDPESDKNIEPKMGIDPEAIKPIQLSHGEHKYDILPTAELPIKVDGEKTSVSLQDLMSNYAGKVAYDKRFNDLNKERQQFKSEERAHKQEMDFVNNKINSIEF